MVAEWPHPSKIPRSRYTVNRGQVRRRTRSKNAEISGKNRADEQHRKDQKTHVCGCGEKRPARAGERKRPGRRGIEETRNAWVVLDGEIRRPRVSEKG